jgi:hypothetical protein
MSAITTAARSADKRQGAWSPNAIGFITLFCTFLPGGILWALNYSRLGQPDKTRPRMIGVIIGYLAMWTLAFLEIENADVARAVDVVIRAIHPALGFLFYQQQKDLFKQHIDSGGKKASILLPTLLSIAFLVTVIIGILLAAYGSKILQQGFSAPFDNFVADRALAEKNYARAIVPLKRMADAGDAGRQVALGYLYENGMGVERNLEEAAKWYKAAAEQGDPEGQHNLGVSYEKGEGVAMSLDQAEHWYRKAAEQDNVLSQHNLGILLYRQNKNLDEARKWLLTAANQEYAGSQYILGVIYMQGMAVDANQKIGRAWLARAAANGHEKARELLAGK